MLVRSLIEQVQWVLNRAERLKNYDSDALEWRENAGSWNILECLEHLNLYGDFYLPQIEAKIENAKRGSDIEFNTGILGNYFAKSMLPKEKLNKMKTFKDKNPINAQLDKSVIERFVHQQIHMRGLLEASRKVSLNKIKIQTSISAMLRLKLGDTFRFLINHMIRHFEQIGRVESLLQLNVDQEGK